MAPNQIHKNDRKSTNTHDTSYKETN